MNQKLPTPEEQRRLVLAVFLSMLVIMGYFVFVKPQQVKHHAVQTATASIQPMAVQGKTQNYPDGMRFRTADEMAKKENLRVVKRYALENNKLSGLIANGGGRIDLIKLKNYKKDLDSDELVTLLDADGNNPYSLETGWLSIDPSVAVPNVHSFWKEQGTSDKDTIRPNNTVYFRHDAETGLSIKRVVQLDDDYLVRITDTVVNNYNRMVVLYPYSRITRTNHPVEGRSVVHEGPVAYINEDLHEPSYGKLVKEKSVKFVGPKGWLGITDKYWLTAIIPDQTTDKQFRFSAKKLDKDNTLYQADVRGAAVELAPGQSATVSNNFFVGAKELDLLNRYEDELGVEHFDLAIDFGWYYFITKPFSIFLSEIGGYLKAHGFHVAFGMALLIFTIMVRLATFPLANKAFRSMNAMKKLQPRMKQIKEDFGKDPENMQKALLELYQTEKVTPFSGCWPMFVQIPIFFALYKTLYISLDMRHAPFWGWVNDLSAPDPTSVLNLFGLIPIDLPSALVIGIWPILYGLTMSMQKRLNPAPMDKMQDTMMMWMPWIFTYMFSQLPAGMVIYFVWSNILGMAQQYWLQQKMGLQPSLFKRKTVSEYTDMVMTSDKIKTVRDWSKVQDAVEVKEKAAKPVTPKTKSPKKKSKKKK